MRAHAVSEEEHSATCQLGQEIAVKGDYQDTRRLGSGPHQEGCGIALSGFRSRILVGSVVPAYRYQECTQDTDPGVSDISESEGSPILREVGELRGSVSD
ncbi:unnamed protein product [Phytophthora fragariaefolia]|uniref:Unnamed protein product n=1 Tax=Phytophthora fragariaefolia TaxID=1490495 RepID=A0A9W6TLE8_9STRA|nr:unnamed protein product [Phytophthora fragariaefolia]